MTPYAALSRRGQLARLRQLGRSALSAFGVEGGRLTVLRHEHNTTFRVDTDGGPFVLRINRPGVHTAQTIASEMAWLDALGRESDVGVPSPVAASGGTKVVTVATAEVPEPRVCVLLRWQEGRFVDKRLTAMHLSRVGSLMAQLQDHASGWRPPAGFARPRVDTLTNLGKVASIARSPDIGTDRPSRDDAELSLGLIADLLSEQDVALFSEALQIVWTTTRSLRASSGVDGLIHGDLHQENVLFHDGGVRAIDFDDCGWGHHLYDLAVPLSELEGHARYPALRAALLEAYARSRSLQSDYERHLAAFALLRRMQILMWILESREHAAFRDEWREWSREELDGIAEAMR
jgi:Ser/Thr protein kinase RdoA (MazF antagonist)